MAAGLAEHDDRDLETGTGCEAMIDGLLDPEIGATRVADRGDSGRQRPLEISGRLEELVRERTLDGSPEIDARNGDVRVAVEQARQDRPIAKVDLGVAGEAGPEADEAVAIDRDVGTSGSAAGAVEDHRSPQDRSGHRTSSSSAAGVVPASSSIL